MPETNVSPYAHNLVSSLYVMKGLLESFLLQYKEGREEPLTPNGARGKSEQILAQACGQANQAIAIAKRLEEGMKGSQERVCDQPSDFKVSVKETWRNTLQLLKKDFPLEKIEILERIPEPFPLIRCHPADFGEMLYHLARNSLEAMKGTGKLVIRAHLSLSPRQESFAMIHLADTGPGIPGPVLSRLFLPFSTTKKSNGGTGLGLFLTVQLVRRNSGRITVSSFKGYGTSFALELPLA